MRTKILVLGIACLFLTYLNWGQETKHKTHFREAIWGMSQIQIKALEKGKFIGEDRSSATGLDFLAYAGEAGNLSCSIGYLFAEDQLVEGRYLFTAKHVNKLLFIDDFRKVKESITEKYGKPTKDEVFWRNDLYKNDPSDWGMALCVGHLTFEVVWDMPETVILLQILGDNYKVSHRLQYTSRLKKHKELVRKALEKAKKGIW